MSEASFDGIYNDGERAGAEPVRVTVKEDGLLLASPRGPGLALWPYAEIVRHPDDAEGHVRLGLARGSEARLSVADPGFADALRAKAPALFRRRRLGATLRLALLLGAVSAAVIGGAYLGLPRAAEALAPYVPPAVETQIGQRYFQAMTRMWPACTLDEPARRALDGLSARLLGKTALPFAVRVDVIDIGIENAFALPGGHVVFTRPILQRMKSPDELAGVLAHELGHVVERHAMIGVIQDTGLSTLLSILTGGGSGSGEWALNTAGNLASLSYSRRLETRADTHGLAMLRDAGIDPGGIATLFERWQKEEEAQAIFTLPPFLNSHPATPERIARARAAADPKAKPALSAEDWSAVQAACAPKKADKPAEPKTAPPKQGKETGH